MNAQSPRSGFFQYPDSAALEKNLVKSANDLLRVSVSAEYAYVDVDGYSENGAGVLNLKIAGSDQDSLILGGEYKYCIRSERPCSERISAKARAINLFPAKSASVLPNNTGGQSRE
uniref:Uncharacterized protein n=1 Tax=Candidatus Kentrum sp. DK TaxID=2126562 RepID=A0A450SSB8_9GAMM|nr:MAG: hypothetical protein BECKDK2373B_GA0170837_106123 [Candidatus Kentron sp. DK]